MAKFDPKIVTLIRNENEKFSISLDYDEIPENPYPVFLYVPDVNEAEHYHIQLDSDAAKKLKDWLNTNVE